MEGVSATTCPLPQYWYWVHSAAHLLTLPGGTACSAPQAETSPGPGPLRNSPFIDNIPEALDLTNTSPSFKAFALAALVQNVQENVFPV